MTRLQGKHLLFCPRSPWGIPGSSLSPLWKCPPPEWLVRSFISPRSFLFFKVPLLAHLLFFLGLTSDSHLSWPAMALISSSTLGDTWLYPIWYLCPTFHGSYHSKITWVPQEGSMSVLFCIVMLSCMLAGILVEQACDKHGVEIN